MEMKSVMHSLSVVKTVVITNIVQVGSSMPLAMLLWPKSLTAIYINQYKHTVPPPQVLSKGSLKPFY